MLIQPKKVKGDFHGEKNGNYDNNIDFQKQQWRSILFDKNIDEQASR